MPSCVLRHRVGIYVINYEIKDCYETFNIYYSNAAFSRAQAKQEIDSVTENNLRIPWISQFALIVPRIDTVKMQEPKVKPLFSSNLFFAEQYTKLYICMDSF